MRKILILNWSVILTSQNIGIGSSANNQSNTISIAKKVYPKFAITFGFKQVPFVALTGFNCSHTKGTGWHRNRTTKRCPHSEDAHAGVNEGPVDGFPGGCSAEEVPDRELDEGGGGDVEDYPEVWYCLTITNHILRQLDLGIGRKPS